MSVPTAATVGHNIVYGLLGVKQVKHSGHLVASNKKNQISRRHLQTSSQAGRQASERKVSLRIYGNIITLRVRQYRTRRCGGNTTPRRKNIKITPKKAEMLVACSK